MTEKEINITKEFAEKYKVKEAFLQLEKDFQDQTQQFRKYWHNFEPDALSQAIGYFQEAALRAMLNDINIENRCGNPKNINEDDIIIEKYLQDSIESKGSHRKYTKKRGQIQVVSWYTARSGKADRKVNFILSEFEYIKDKKDFMNDKFIYHKIYISYQMISYNDITSTNISENFIKDKSILIELHKDEE